MFTNNLTHKGFHIIHNVKSYWMTVERFPNSKHIAKRDFKILYSYLLISFFLHFYCFHPWCKWVTKKRQGILIFLVAFSVWPFLLPYLKCFALIISVSYLSSIFHQKSSITELEFQAYKSEQVSVSMRVQPTSVSQIIDNLRQLLTDFSEIVSQFVCNTVNVFVFS